MTQPSSSHVWNARDYAANARFVADLATPLVDLLAARPGERILDLGCGDGALTQTIAAAGAIVTAVDGAPGMVAAAQARGVSATLMDGQCLDFEAEFDAVFSNAALHWMPDAAAVLQGVARALKPGGRFVAELGGHGNVASIATALRAAVGEHCPDQGSPWFFPTAEQYGAMLERNGFRVRDISLIPRPTVLPTGLSGWLTTFAGPFLGDLPAAVHAAVLEEVERLLAPSLRTSDGVWIADYVRLRVLAVLG